MFTWRYQDLLGYIASAKFQDVGADTMELLSHVNVCRQIQKAIIRLLQTDTDICLGQRMMMFRLVDSINIWVQYQRYPLISTLNKRKL